MSRIAGVRIAITAFVLAEVACQGAQFGRSATAAPTATYWPTVSTDVTTAAPAVATQTPDNSDIGAFSGTPIDLDLPEVTPLPDFTATGVLRWPLPLPGVLKQIYGPQHRGIDIAAPPNTPVLAADSGVVVYAEQAEGYGNLVVLDHGNGYQTWYGHLSGFAVRTLDGVQQGQEIGYVGSTGASSGPHLHLEVRYHGRPVPPLSHLQDVPQSILEASAGSERRTATAIAAATQTAAAIFAAQTATARYLAGQTATVAYFVQLTVIAREATRAAGSRTPTPTFTGTPSATPTPTASATSETATASPSPTATMSPPPDTATATATLEPGSATPPSQTPTPSDTPSS